jgi:hypothetical protein
MSQIQYDFKNRTTLERNKIHYCNYEYFIADECGKRIKEIDSKYYNCNLIGKKTAFCREFDCDENGNEETRNYDTIFSYFEFSYNFSTPKYTLIETSRSDTYGEFNEPFSEIEGWDSESENLEKNSINEEFETESTEIGNKELILKAIINDSGEIVFDGIAEIVEFISSVEAIIIKLPIYKWSNLIDYEKFQTKEDWYLTKLPSSSIPKFYYAVINLKGEIIIQPTLGRIEFLKNTKLFIVADYLVFDEYGFKQNRYFKDLFFSETEFDNFIYNKQKLSEL